MIRLFVSQALQKQTLISLDDKTYHYLLHVMRCKNDDLLLCFNGLDGEWQAQLKTQGKKGAALFVLSQTRSQTQPDFCALCPALIKKDNMDLILQKATELGVTDIYPLITEHTVHPHFNLAHANLIVREAAEQSERLTLPTIHDPVPLAMVLKQLPTDCTCCYLAERSNGENTLSQTMKPAFFIGPEGGWSSKELAFFRQHHFLSLHFNVGILRAETANIAILSYWQISRDIMIKK